MILQEFSVMQVLVSLNCRGPFARAPSKLSILFLRPHRILREEKKTIKPLFLPYFTYGTIT